MRAFFQDVPKCSEMDNPSAGTGSGGDRCTEAVAAMIDVLYRLGPRARAAQSVADNEAIMYSFVQYLNKGANVSALEDFGTWFPAWLTKTGYDKVLQIAPAIPLTWADCQRIINAGHVAVIQVADYSQLKAFDGSDPFAWNPAGTHVGHVLLLVGYDDDYSGHGQTLIVHDPLRGTDGQPWDYQYQSVKDAQALLLEVNGPSLAPPPAPPPPPPPPPPPTVDYQAILDTLETEVLAALDKARKATGG